MLLWQVYFKVCISQGKAYEYWLGRLIEESLIPSMSENSLLKCLSSKDSSLPHLILGSQPNGIGNVSSNWYHIWLMRNKLNYIPLHLDIWIAIVMSTSERVWISCHKRSVLRHTLGQKISQFKYRLIEPEPPKTEKEKDFGVVMKSSM